MESLENKPFLTCRIYITAIELRYFLWLSLSASFLNEILEIPAFGKSDNYITEKIDSISETYFGTFFQRSVNLLIKEFILYIYIYKSVMVVMSLM